MRVLVCGGRDFGVVHGSDEWKFIVGTLDDLNGDCWPSEAYPLGKEPPKITHLIAGGAPGVDTVAADWAITNWVPFTEFKADWERHGYTAGPLRNKQMLDEGKPDLVVAFPGGKGTANMKAQARAAGVPVVEFEP